MTPEGAEGLAYLHPDFRHDVFVSYSHGDVDHTGLSKLKAWSQAFVRDLEGEIRSNPKFKGVRVFLDEGHRHGHALDPTLPLTDQLRGGIASSALLAVLMTPHYCGSRWCADERTWWLAESERGRLPIKGRVFVARIWPPDSDQDWPAELTDQGGHSPIGFWFHPRDEDEFTVRPFGWDAPNGQRAFGPGLVKMAGAVCRRLSELKAALAQAREREVAAAKLAAPGGQVLYLQARAAHAERWERAARNLEDEGYVIVPCEPEPLTSDPRRIRELAEERVRQLTGCDALLLLGTEDGASLDSDMVVVGRQDRSSARARCDKLLPCAVLDTAGGPIRSDRRLNMARGLGIEWVDGVPPAWPLSLRGWLMATSARVEAVG